MIPQGLRPIAGLLTIATGLLVIVNHWIGILESDVDLLTSHAIGLIGLLSGMNIMSGDSDMTEEARANYVEDTQTKF